MFGRTAQAAQGRHAPAARRVERGRFSPAVSPVCPRQSPQYTDNRPPYITGGRYIAVPRSERTAPPRRPPFFPFPLPSLHDLPWRFLSRIIARHPPFLPSALRSARRSVFLILPFLSETAVIFMKIAELAVNHTSHSAIFGRIGKARKLFILASKEEFKYNFCRTHAARGEYICKENL